MSGPGEPRDSRPRARSLGGRRRLHSPKTIEAYLQANEPPRYMRRLAEIETEYSRQCSRLAEARAELGERCAGDGELFARLWDARAREWPFGVLNQLVREHNDWYPIEANLGMDPRTRDYVPVRGASYRRVELDPAWILEHFPPGLDAAHRAPGRAPREPARSRRRLQRTPD